MARHRVSLRSQLIGHLITAIVLDLLPGHTKTNTVLLDGGVEKLRRRQRIGHRDLPTLRDNNRVILKISRRCVTVGHDIRVDILHLEERIKCLEFVQALTERVGEKGRVGEHLRHSEIRDRIPNGRNGRYFISHSSSSFLVSLPPAGC
ncbi:hypothetical protein I6I10_07010 [Corynebacterium glucuronolyticum]|uniref:Uncharacterized protein n=1 Tax=Corynebacterium glucuronolyticum TaxID=39791 RepID=A0A7T4EDE8_9CORY|nr:hypothetical protein [Corynebacterium glucuronolyticum]QQB45291.1 hypothetical protein I6I10_07010 [Corynebacterium glucuronolyticum]